MGYLYRSDVPRRFSFQELFQTRQISRFNKKLSKNTFCLWLSIVLRYCKINLMPYQIVFFFEVCKKYFSESPNCKWRTFTCVASCCFILYPSRPSTIIFKTLAFCWYCCNQEGWNAWQRGTCFWFKPSTDRSEVKLGLRPWPVFGAWQTTKYIVDCNEAGCSRVVSSLIKLNTPTCGPFPWSTCTAPGFVTRKLSYSVFFYLQQWMGHGPVGPQQWIIARATEKFVRIANVLIQNPVAEGRNVRAIVCSMSNVTDVNATMGAAVNMAVN